MPEHDWNMPHDIRALGGKADPGDILQDGYYRNGCPPKCPAAIRLPEDYPAKGEYDKHFPDRSKMPVDRSEMRGRIYISGPMRGKPKLNHESFDGVANVLAQQNWYVHSPAQKDRDEGLNEKTPYATAIRYDVEMLLDSDAICLLPGWRASEGARFEAEIARSLGLTFYEASYLEHGLSEIVDGGWKVHKVDVPTIGVEGIDQEARRLVYGERAQTYGHPRGDFDCIAGIWAAMISTKVKFWAFKNGVELPDMPWYEIIDAELATTMMTGLKAARQVKSPDHRDTMVDIIGYQLCQARLQESPEEIRAWENRDTTSS